MRGLTVAAMLGCGWANVNADYDSTNTSYDASFLQDKALTSVTYDTLPNQSALETLTMYDFVGSMPLPTSGSETVSTTYDWSADINGSSVTGTGTMSTQVTYDSMSGPVTTYDQTVTAYDAIGHGTAHTYDVRLDLTQMVSPETVTAESGGIFHVSSFFDIFTELSVDGGTFAPADTSNGRSGQIKLTPVETPEPVTLGLVAFGIGIAAARRWRQLNSEA